MLQTQETFSYVLLNAAVFPNQNYANTSIMCIECLSIWKHHGTSLTLEVLV